MSANGVVDADVGPVVGAVNENIVPGVLHHGTIHVDKGTVEDPAVEAKVTQEHRQQRGVVGTVAGALEHHFISEAGDVVVGIVVHMAAGGGAAKLLPPDDLAAVVFFFHFLGKTVAAGIGHVRFAEVTGAVPVIAIAVGDDPVVDGQDLLPGGFAGGGDFLQNLLGHIVGLDVAGVDGNPGRCCQSGDRQNADQQNQNKQSGQNASFHG